MMDLLGQNRKVMVDKDILQPRGMVIDMQKLRLYWVDSRKGTVESIFLRTFDLHRNVIRTDSGTRFFDIAVFQVGVVGSGWGWGVVGAATELN